MTTPARVILLACGSFNPITNMHLRMFELGKDFLNGTGRFHVIGGIISPVNDAYGKKELAQAKHRCAMVQLALKTTPWIRLDTWESEQDGWMETVKLLRYHQGAINHPNAINHLLPSSPSKKKRSDEQNANIAESKLQGRALDGGPLQVKLLCGADFLESFAVPGLWSDEDILEIVSQFGIVVISRSGSSPEKFIYESDILSKHRHNIFVVTEWIPNEICSTRIRRALRRGQSVKYLLQESVIHYIQQHHLYSVPGAAISSTTSSSADRTIALINTASEVGNKNLSGFRATTCSRSTEDSGGGDPRGVVLQLRPGVRGHSAPRPSAADHHVTRGGSSSSQHDVTVIRSQSTDVHLGVHQSEGPRWRSGGRDEGGVGSRGGVSRGCLRATRDNSSGARSMEGPPTAAPGVGGARETVEGHQRRPHFGHHCDERGRRPAVDRDHGSSSSREPDSSRKEAESRRKGADARRDGDHQTTSKELDYKQRETDPRRGEFELRKEEDQKREADIRRESVARREGDLRRDENPRRASESLRDTDARKMETRRNPSDPRRETDPRRGDTSDSGSREGGDGGRREGAVGRMEGGDGGRREGDVGRREGGDPGRREGVDGGRREGGDAGRRNPDPRRAVVRRTDVPPGGATTSSAPGQRKDTASVGSRSHTAEVMQYVVREELVRLRPETCV